MQGSESIIAVSNQNNLSIINLQDFKLLNTITLQYPTSLVRCFDELPDVMFFAIQDPQSQSFFVQIMFADSQLIANEPHQGPITDMFYMVLNGQRVLFTASSDSRIRAFTLKEDNTLEKQLEHPV